MQAIQDMVAKSIVSYEQMSALVAPNGFERTMGSSKNIAIKPDLLNRVLDLTKNSSVYQHSVLYGIQQFEQTYKGTAIALPELVKLAERGVKLGDLAKLFENNNSSDSLDALNSQKHSLQLLVEKLVAENASKDQLNAKRVRSLDLLNNTFGADSPSVQEILELEGSSKPLTDLQSFLKPDPINRGEFLKRQLQKDPKATNFEPDRLQNLYSIETAFGSDSPYVKKIQDLAKISGIRYQDIASFLEPSNYSKLLKSSIGEKPTTGELHAELAADSPAKKLLRQFLDQDVEPGQTIIQLPHCSLKVERISR